MVTIVMDWANDYLEKYGLLLRISQFEIYHN